MLFCCRKYIGHNGSEVTKNHREYIKNCTGGEIQEVKDSEMCLVKSYSVYTEKLNPELNALFQRPRPKCNINDGICFENKPLGNYFLGDD